MTTNIGKYYDICGAVTENPDSIYFDENNRIYEVIRIINGKPLFFDDHMDRFDKSYAKAGYTERPERVSLYNRIVNIVKINGYTDCNIKVIAGYYVINDLKVFRDLIYINNFSYPREDEYENGVRLSILDAERPDPNLKLLRDDYRQKVLDALENTGAFEVLIADRKCNITEGGKSNAYFIKDNTVYTAPDKYVLIGITRKYVFEACSRVGIKIEEKCVSTKDISSYDGIFISGTPIHVLPAATVDGMTFNTAHNEVFLKIKEVYGEIVNASVGR